MSRFGASISNYMWSIYDVLEGKIKVEFVRL
jgi:hypothetical protein